MAEQNNQLNVFKTVAEFSSDWLMWLTANHTIKYISPAVETITGYAPQEFIEDPNLFKQLIHPEDKASVLQEFEDELSNPHTCSIEFRILHKDGSVRWVAHRCRPVFDDNKKIIGRVSSNRDITIKEAAAQDMLKMMRIIEQSAEAVAITDIKGHIEYVNPAFEKMTGYSLTEIQQVNQENLKSEKRFQDQFKEIFDTISKGNIWHGQSSAQRKDGTTYYVDSVVFPLKDESGEIINYAKISRDITKQKELENSLRKQEELLRTLINSTPDIICFKDGQGRWLEANDADLKLFELENVDYHGKKDSELAQYSVFYYDAFMACEDSDEITWKKGAMSRGIEIIPIPDGSEKVYDVIKVPLFEEDGSRKGLVVLGRDITEMKQVEKILKQSEDRLSKIKLASNDGMWDWNLINNEVYFDPRYYEMAGYSVNEFPHSLEEFQKRIHPDYSDTVMNQAQMHLNGEMDRFNVEFLFKKKNGQWMWILGRGIIVERDEKGVPLRFVGTHTDITDLKKVSEALRKSEEKYRRIFEESQDVIFVSSTEDRVIDINPAGLQLFGYSSLNEIRKVDIAKELYKNPQDRRKYKQRLRENGFIKDYELELKRKDGTELIVVENSTAVYDEDKNIIACRGIIRDITEEKRLKAQLAQAQKMESIGTLAGGVAHDFNNLLTVINGYAEMALLHMEADNPLHKDILSILKAGKRAENLTSQLLAFSRKQIFKPEILDINQVISSMDKMLRRLIDEDINIETVFVDHLSEIKADTAQLEQIFVNLIVNARDALRAVKKPDFQKKITIETGQIFLDKEYASKHPGSQQGLHIFFSISDNGIGMDEQTKEKVFEPFFTTKEKYKGTGLGLSMVYGIVKQNNGSVYVYSEPGEGTMFKIYWPATEEKKQTEKATVSDEILYGNETVLIVEDEEEVCRFASEALTSLGYNVYKADNGRVALELINNGSQKFDLIVTDLIMPELNGKEFIEKVRKFYPDVKVIYVSGYTDNHIVHNGMLEEGVNFIHKPYSVKTLASTVRIVLDEK